MAVRRAALTLPAMSFVIKQAYRCGSLLAFATLVLGPSLAWGQEDEEDDAPALGPSPNRAYAEQVNREARGLGVGYSNGLWGSGYAQSIRFDIPFGYTVGQFFGLRIHGVMAYGPSSAPEFDPAAFGGAELFGRGPVIFGLVRLYGGGGVFVGGRPVDRPGDRFGISGGGHMGLELFSTPNCSFSVEVGGQGPVHAEAIDAGASVMGGMTVYLGGG